MKKTYTKSFLVLALIFTANLTIFAQGWDWVKQIKGKNSNTNISKTTAIKRNDAGEIYLAGSFNDTVTFDASQFVSTGLSPGFTTPDGFVAKFDPNGNFIWLKQFKSIASTEISDISVDADGNIYATGTFSGTVTVDTFTRKGANNNATMLMAKISPSGNILWLNITLNGTGGYSRGLAIIAGSNKDFMVSGTLEKKTKIGGMDIDAKSDIRFILARFDENGKLRWAKATGETNPLSPKIAMTKDLASNLYMTGSLSDINTFDTVSFDALNKGSFFVTKFDSTGKLKWFLQSDMPSLLEEGNGIGYHGSGNVCVTGTFAADKFSVGGLSVNRATKLGGREMFVMNIEWDGKVNWIRQSHGPAPDCRGMSLVKTSNNSIFVTGRYGSPTSGGAVSFDVTLGEGGNQVLLKNGGLLDIFVAKYSNNGDLLWVNKVTGVNAEESYAVATDGNSAFVTGIFRKDATFGNIDLKTSPYPIGVNMFYAKVSGPSGSIDQMISRTSRLLIYPQPASSKISIRIPEAHHDQIIRIYSSQGQLMMDQVNSSVTIELDVTDFADGMYFIEVLSGNNRYSSKLLVSK